MAECPLCLIPSRETLLYKDDICYIVNTKDIKGHKLRVMVVTNCHTETPTAEEFAHCLDRLKSYMESNCPTETFYLVFGTYASVPQHYHIIGCDDILNLSESKLMFSSEYVRCLIHINRRKVVIGIPARNEEKYIEEIIEESMKFGSVVVLNNGSNDMTKDLAEAAGAKVLDYDWSGYGRALYEIFKYAKSVEADVLITLDGDGQHNPNEIPKFLTAIQDSDVVVGNRFLAEEKVPLHRRAVIKGLNTFYGIGDSQCGFRAYNKKALESITITEDGMGASLDILNMAKEMDLKISEVPCTITYNEPEKPFSNLLKQGLNLINTVFWGLIWARPYTFLGIPAMILFIAALASGIQVLDVYLRQGYLIGTLALFCGVSFLSSLALISVIFFIIIQRKVIKELSRK